MAKRQRLDLIDIDEPKEDYQVVFCDIQKKDIKLKIKPLKRFRQTGQIREFRVFCEPQCDPGCDYYDNSGRADT